MIYLPSLVSTPHYDTCHNVQLYDLERFCETLQMYSPVHTSVSQYLEHPNEFEPLLFTGA